MSLGQYARFLVVGAFVGLVTVGSRELIGHLLAADTRQNYSVSIGLAYVIGIMLSFLLNRHFTFGGDDKSRQWGNLPQFVAVAIFGLFCTWGLSLALRYGMHLDAFIGSWAKPAAFAAATLLASMLTYPLNSLFVFGARRRRGVSAPRSVT